MDDDGSADHAVNPLQIRHAVREIRGKSASVGGGGSGLDEKVAPIADVALGGGDVAVLLPLGIEMTAGRLASVGHDGARLMDVESAFLGRAFVEAAQIDGDFETFDCAGAKRCLPSSDWHL